jgi:two-component system, NarL family, nitrate/nitrite response regulator NarL
MIKLTKRESQVIEGLKLGLPNKQIAFDMGISENTVKNYMMSIFDKKNVHNRVELLLKVLGQAGAEN